MPVKVVKSKKTVTEPVPTPVETPVQTQDETPVEVPVEVPVETPVEVVVETPVVDESSSEILFKKLNAQFQDLVVAMKTIQTNLKVLEKEVAKDRKELQKKCKKKNDKKKASGFAVPTPITNELSSFLGLPNDSHIARTDVTSQVIAYVKTHNLQNPENKKQIFPNEALANLLQAPAGDVITFFNIQTYLKKHFLPPVPQVVEASTEPAVV
jgi:upstream activation factor subunit UAF30